MTSNTASYTVKSRSSSTNNHHSQSRLNLGKMIEVCSSITVKLSVLCQSESLDWSIFITVPYFPVLATEECYLTVLSCVYLLSISNIHCYCQWSVYTLPSLLFSIVRGFKEHFGVNPPSHKNHNDDRKLSVTKTSRKYFRVCSIANSVDGSLSAANVWSSVSVSVIILVLVTWKLTLYSGKTLFFKNIFFSSI